MATGKPQFLNGVPELLVLRLLAQREMYGYEIVAAIRTQSGDVLRFGEGCIYPILHRLEAEGSLSSTKRKVGGRTRVVYRATAKGKRALKGSQSQWQAVAHAINSIIDAPAEGPASVAS